MKRIVVIDPCQVNVLDLRAIDGVVYLRKRKRYWGSSPAVSVIDIDNCTTLEELDEESKMLYNIILKKAEGDFLADDEPSL